MGRLGQGMEQMRIPLDYDYLLLEKILDDVAYLVGKFQLSPSIELMETSPSKYTIILEGPASLDTAVEIVQESKCDEHYKDFVSRRRVFTERVTRKNLIGKFPLLVSFYIYNEGTLTAQA